MSEYQYYEFRAIDRSLARDEMAELRALSTRAEITPTRFVNEYQWGDFKGDPRKLMERYFDAFVYWANWGTRWLILRLPAGLIDLRTAKAYCDEECVSVWKAGEHLLVEFDFPHEDIEVDWEADWLADLLPLRAELLGGDLRPLYLGWLAAVAAGTTEVDAEEPPIPPGMDRLTPAQDAFTAFLELPQEMLMIAAEQSSPELATPDRKEWRRWIAALAPEVKDRWLLQAAEGNAPHLQSELLRMWRAEHQAFRSIPAPPPRTAGELSRRLDALHEAETRRREEERAAAQARADAKRLAQRNRYLDDLEAREDAVWKEVDALVAMKQPAKYAAAVVLLRDLQELADRRGTRPAMTARLADLRDDHARKPAFLERLKRAGL